MSIDKHEFADSISEMKAEPLQDAETVVINIAGGSWIFFDKSDVIALAKHFKLTAHDIDCQEFKELQAYSDSADEEHLDEIKFILDEKIKINRKVS